MVTGSMKRMLSETRRRRRKQIEYNKDHGIIPKTVYKTTEEVLAGTAVADIKAARDGRHRWSAFPKVAESIVRYLNKEQREDLIEELRTAMLTASRDLEFERAAELRDEIERLEHMIQ
jgi:excinuclease ABC subunit B